MPDPITPSGCAHCGMPERLHARRWTRDAGWHDYTQPTTEQIRQRMLARRELQAITATTVDALREITANLQAHIEARAAELAAPAIAEAERQAAERVAAAERDRDQRQQRSDDLIAELRRQLAVLERRAGGPAGDHELVIDARDLDAAINTDGPDAWAAERRLRAALDEHTARARRLATDRKDS